MYVNQFGEKTDDLSKATSYILYQKMDNDSAWLMKEYDMGDTIKTIGMYKDEQLTIPNGKFTYYEYVKPGGYIKYNYNSHKKDTIIIKSKNYIAGTGFFVNGVKTGKWSYFDSNGQIIVMNTYQNNRKNGLTQNYNTQTGKVYAEGQYANDIKTGNWYMLAANGDTTSIDEYNSGRFIKSKKTTKVIEEEKLAAKRKIKGGYPAYDVSAYLNRKLVDVKLKGYVNKRISYWFTLNKEGKLIDPHVTDGFGFETDKIIIEALMSSPKWKPAIVDGELIEGSVRVVLDVKFEDESPIFRNVDGIYTGEKHTKIIRVPF